MKKSIMLLSFMVAMLFAMGGNIQLTSVESAPTIGFETAYAQDAPKAEEKKAEAPAEAKAEEKKVPVLDEAKADKADKDLEADVFLKALMESVGGMKGLGSMGLAALIIQLLMMFFRTKLAAFAGKWKMMIVWALTTIGGVLAMKYNGADWTSALVHSQTLTAAQGWIHQMYKQFVEKKDEKAA